MASGKTANYGLSQWEATDQVVRGDFDEDNRKIDTGMAENKAAAAAAKETAENLAAVAFTPENLPFVVGTYTGNSQRTNNDSNTQDIILGFTPRFVAVFYASANSNATNGSSQFAMISQAETFKSSNYTVMAIIENGFRVGTPMYNSTETRPSLNGKNDLYHYFALK